MKWPFTLERLIWYRTLYNNVCALLNMWLSIFPRRTQHQRNQFEEKRKSIIPYRERFSIITLWKTTKCLTLNQFNNWEKRKTLKKISMDNTSKIYAHLTPTLSRSTTMVTKQTTDLLLPFMYISTSPNPVHQQISTLLHFHMHFILAIQIIV